MYFQTWFTRKWNFLCNFIIPHFRIISSHRISMTSFVSWISTYNSSKVTSSQLEFRNFRNWNGIWYDFRKNFKRIAEKNVVFFSFERFCIYLVGQLSPEYDVEVQFNFAIIAKLRMNSNKSYEAVRCQLTCNFVLPYWTSSAKTAFEEKDTKHCVRELLSERTRIRTIVANYTINGNGYKWNLILRNHFAIY